VTHITRTADTSADAAATPAQPVDDLRQNAIRGALARICAQVVGLLLRVGSLTVLARLLDPKDFGLVGMVSAFTGVLYLFRDFGLSAASVQRSTVTLEQKSTLFWLNLLVGAALTIFTAACAPLVAAFYHEPRICWITVVLAAGFLFNAAGIQHSALLQRQMRFTALSIIEVVSWFASIFLAVLMARRGSGYWSIVVMTISLPLTGTISVWITARWIPKLPRRNTDIREMLRFGGALTVNGIVVYLASNFEKILLGRFWGAEAIGIYGRAYQLVRIPIDNLNSAIGEVAFSALSRLQHDPARLKSYFLKGYSLVVALTLPVTLACGLFADDLIAVLLGPKWKEAAPIFRLLAPTLLVFAVANPLGWLLSSIGLVRRSLHMSVVIAPIMIGSYFIALPYGPRGVALVYSVVMLLWVVPVTVWSLHGTVISPWDILASVIRPLTAGILAVGFALPLRFLHGLLPLPRLIGEGGLLVIAYSFILLYGMGQRHLYISIIRGQPPAYRKTLATA